MVLPIITQKEKGKYSLIKGEWLTFAAIGLPKLTNNIFKILKWWITL